MFCSLIHSCCKRMFCVFEVRDVRNGFLKIELRDPTLKKTSNLVWVSNTCLIEPRFNATGMNIFMHRRLF